MALTVALLALGGLVGFLFFAVAREPGPSPEDVAVAYELAWDRLDFSTLFDLSAPALHDGLNRESFVAAKRATYARAQPAGRLGAEVGVESCVTLDDAAHVVTVVRAGAGQVRNDLRLERANGRWSVTTYTLRPEPDRPSSPTS